jgi:hypothetical protein
VHQVPGALGVEQPVCLSLPLQQFARTRIAQRRAQVGPRRPQRAVGGDRFVEAVPRRFVPAATQHQ